VCVCVCVQAEIGKRERSQKYYRLILTIKYY